MVTCLQRRKWRIGGNSSRTRFLLLERCRESSRFFGSSSLSTLALFFFVIPGPTSRRIELTISLRSKNREESESSSELKNVAGAPPVDPHGPLVNGAETIKDSIDNFIDARKSDIDNEHLPPDLIDPADHIDSTSADFTASPTGMGSPSEMGEREDSFDSGSGGMGGDGGNSTAPSSPIAPDTPGRSRSPSESNGDSREMTASARFKKGHGRQSSLGTTMTSPSTRRRSLENTISLIREAMTSDDSKMGSFFLSFFFPPSSAFFLPPPTSSTRPYTILTAIYDKQRNSQRKSQETNPLVRLPPLETQSPDRPIELPPRLLQCVKLSSYPPRHFHSLIDSYPFLSRPTTRRS